ncbi:MAG: hypothetical protein CL843_18105 [Crocinitomicaceae bacterium]|nr:hypothetical protein [Crocinitomicaceae bacterium]|tara:strand:- start:5836 stop:8493 length:2658 start_codon:yes stop_codon:yes gene_type:complete
MKKIYTVILSLLGLSTVSQAQWVISTTGATTDTITFDASFTGVNNGAFTGSGLDSSPASGLLNSNAWIVTGMSDGSTSFGGTFTSGDFARGASTGGASSGGLYSFEVASGDVAFGVQPGGSDFTPGTMTLAVVNGTGSTVDSVALYYDLFINNDADRGNTFNPSYAVNILNNSTALSTLNDTSIEATQGSVAWIAYPKSIVFPQTLNANDTLYITWSSDDLLGGGSRDEFALDNIAVSFLTTAPAAPATPTYDIADINNVDANGEPDSNGVVCWTKGVVLGVNLRPSGLQFTIWDNEGIGAFNYSGNFGYTVNEGDSVLVLGTVDHFNGLAQMALDSVVLVNSGNTIPTPTVVNALDESTESELIKIENVLYVSSSVIVSGTDTFALYIDGDTDVNDSLSLSSGDSLCYVIGIGSQYDNSSPYTSGYQIIPRYYTDIDTSCGTTVTPPTVVIPTYDIEVLRTVNSGYEPDSLGVYCAVEGIVYGVNIQSGGLSFTVIDETDGINVFNYNSDLGYTVTEGDEIRVVGEIDFYNGLTELVADSITILSTDNCIPFPTIVDELDESTESNFIELRNVSIVSGQSWPAAGSNANIDVVTSNGDTVTMRIDKDTYIPDSILSAPTGTFNLIGIGGQYDSSNPHDAGYQIFPMFTYDFDTVAHPAPAGLVINELMADNDAVIMDENSEYDDWFELYNGGSSDIDIAGLFVTDDASDMIQYRIPRCNNETTITAGGWKLLWADSDEDQGPLHTNFGLSANGEFLGVYTQDGTVVDSISFDAAITDVSYGRAQDGDTSWVYFSTSTPDASNNNGVVLSVINNGKVGENALQVYPNPATDIVYFNKTVDVQVYNVTGQLVTENKAVNTLDVSDYETGIYIIRTAEGDLVKMIKQ